MGKTKEEYSLERDGYSKTFSIPRALMAIELLSEKERMIIAKIISLSDEHTNKKSCNLSNAVLAKLHFCSVPVVSNAISKANWLGFQQQRIDEHYSCSTEEGMNAYIQNRKLIFTIPDYWEFFGEVWNAFYTKDCLIALPILNWLNKEIKEKWKHRKQGEKLDEKELLTNFKNIFFNDKKFEKYKKLFSILVKSSSKEE